MNLAALILIFLCMEIIGTEPLLQWKHGPFSDFIHAAPVLNTTIPPEAYNAGLHKLNTVLTHVPKDMLLLILEYAIDYNCIPYLSCNQPCLSIYALYEDFSFTTLYPFPDINPSAKTSLFFLELRTNLQNQQNPTVYICDVLHNAYTPLSEKSAGYLWCSQQERSNDARD